MSQSPADVTLRRATQDDIPFMRDLYASVRQAELAAVGFPEAARQQFLATQFAAQYQHYTQHYNSDAFNIVEFNSAPVGRLFVDYWESEIRVVDIALMPEFRGKGIGTYLLEQLFMEAEIKSQPVTIHVEHNNPARSLYERLGFKLKAAGNGIYLLMEWRPKSAQRVPS